jgi:putative inorganic carbon (HCO3(-)) transporter
LLALVVLDNSFQIKKHLFLREDAMDLGSLPGLQISLMNLALTGLYVAWLASVAIRPRSNVPQQQRRLSKVTLPAVLFLLFNALSLIVAGDISLGIFQVWNVLVLFLLYRYVAEKLTSREDVLFVVRILLIGLILQSVLMLAQVGGLVGTFQGYGIKSRADFGTSSRISGTMGSPNPAGAYLAMMMLFALGVMLAEMPRREKYLAGSGFALAAVSLIFVFSRGGWISFLVGLAGIMILGRRRVPWKTVGAVIVALVLLAIPLRSAIADRLYGDDDGSAVARIPLNKLAEAIIADHPVLGVGTNNYFLAMQPYVTHNFAGDWLYTVHNTYLLVWAETGIVGLLSFVWFLIAIVRQGLRSWQMQDPLLAPLALGCAAAVMGFMAQMNFDPFRSESAVELVWLFGGLVVAMMRVCSSSPVVSQPAR